MDLILKILFGLVGIFFVLCLIDIGVCAFVWIARKYYAHLNKNEEEIREHEQDSKIL